MVVTCSAPNCSAKKDNITTKSSIQFHRFPLRKPDVLAKWVKAMKNPNFKPTVTSYLCSAHFSASDYDLKVNNAGKHLKPNAVPTLFEKRKPGRKKKILTEVETPEEISGIKEEFIESKESDEAVREEYLEASDKVESNLADIIGDHEKGTLHVFIVGEDGKITNSEYVFKKDLFSDDEGKQESDAISLEENGDKEMDDESLNQLKENIGDKGSQTDSSPQVSLINYRDLKNREKIKKLESNLALTRKKLKVLQMKCKKSNKIINELKLLLKLLVLKRGKGVKNLTQLCEEYDKFDFEEMKMEIKEEDEEAEGEGVEFLK